MPHSLNRTSWNVFAGKLSIDSPQCVVNMDDSKIEQLIEEVHRRPAIWDKTSDQNRFKAFVGTEWDKVASSLKVAKSQAQTKWKALLARFKREHSRVRLHRSGDGLQDTYESNWPYYQSLLFLSSSVLPKQSTGNLDSLIDVKPSTIDIEFDKTASDQVSEAMSKNKGDIIDDLLRMQSKKYALLEQSLTNKEVENSAEHDKHNRAFFETLLPPLREVSKEDILLCRNDISQVVFKYAYKNAEWKSLSDGMVNPAAAGTPVLPRKRRQKIEEDDDCQFVSSVPPKPLIQSTIKQEKKYIPTTRERTVEHMNKGMIPLGYQHYGYPPQYLRENLYEHPPLLYPGQRYLRSIDNQVGYSQGEILRPMAVWDSYPSTMTSSESMTRQMPQAQASSAVGMENAQRPIPPGHTSSPGGSDSRPRQRPASNVTPAATVDVKYTKSPIPTKTAVTEDMSSTLQSPATLTESKVTMTQGQTQENEENQNGNSENAGATVPDKKPVIELD